MTFSARWEVILRIDACIGVEKTSSSESASGLMSEDARTRHEHPERTVHGD